MTLQASGAISFSDLRGEFGGSTPDAISEYYRGGGLVPDFPANAGIPTSGAVSLSDFYNGTATNPVDLLGDTLVDADSAPVEVGYRINSSGAEESYEGSGGSYASINTWLNLGSAGDYDCRLTVNSGTAPAGSATGTWLDCGTSRAWTLTAPSSSKVNNCTIEIRDGTTLLVLATATVTMSVTVV